MEEEEEDPKIGVKVTAAFVVIQVPDGSDAEDLGKENKGAVPVAFVCLRGTP